jgi:hypothetical protein
VLGQSGIAITFPVSLVHGQPFMFMVELHHTVCVDRLYPFIDMVVGHTLIVFVLNEIDGCTCAP